MNDEVFQVAVGNTRVLVKSFAAAIRAICTYYRSGE
jgi:hypothetical protein